MFSYAESVFPGMSEPLLVAALGFRDTGQKSDRQTDSVEDPDSESENKGILFDRQTGFFCKGKMLQLLKSHQKNTLLGEYLPPKESHSDGQHRDAYSIAFYSCECFRNWPKVDVWLAGIGNASDEERALGKSAWKSMMAQENKVSWLLRVSFWLVVRDMYSLFDEWKGAETGLAGGPAGILVWCACVTGSCPQWQMILCFLSAHKVLFLRYVFDSAWHTMDVVGVRLPCCVSLTWRGPYSCARMYCIEISQDWL